LFDLLPRSKGRPTAKSEADERTPIVSRSHPGVAALRQAFTTAIMPKALVAAHAKPEGPRLPNASEAAADELISVVRADISTNPLSSDIDGNASDEIVAFCSVAETKAKKNISVVNCSQ
jgi:hypothetical protein